MEPTISLSSMLEFIDDEYELNNLPTIELENVLREIKEVELTGGQIVFGNLGQMYPQFFNHLYGKKSLEKTAKIKELIIKELIKRGINPSSIIS